MAVTRDQHGVAHIVALSGGKDSTSLAFLLKEREPRQYNYVCTPTGDELPEMFAHWRLLGSAEMLGSPLIPIMAGTLASEIAGYGSLPSRLQRWCTRKLKIEPYRAWLMQQSQIGPVVSYVGLRADEEGRAGGAYSDIPGVTMRFPLREWGMGEADVLSYLEQRNISIPERTDCARCFWQTLGEWWVLWRQYPDIFASAINDEETTGHTWRVPRRDALGKPVMITRYGLTYASCWRDTWPVRLSDMRKLFEAGHIPKGAARQGDIFRNSGGCRACTL